jgi:hypothetical protein
MELQFADPEAAALCCNLRRLSTRWGTTGGRNVARRLQQMKAAPDLAALQTLPGLCRPDGPDGETWLIDVDGVATIAFRPDPTVPPNHGPAATKRVTVISVIDHPAREGRP